MNLMKSVLLTFLAALTFQAAYADLESIGKEVEYRGNRASELHSGLNLQPVEAIAGSVISPAGNTIKYIGKALSLVQTEGYEEIVEATIDSGTCIAKRARDGQILELAACGVEVGGKTLSITIDFVAREGGNLVYYVTEVASDLAGIWLEAFDACARTLGEENWPKYVRPCTAIAVIFDYTGRLVRAIGLAIYDTAMAVANDTSSLVVNTFNIPASLVRLEPETALQSAGYALRDALCGVVDIVLIIPRFLSEITGHRTEKQCYEFRVVTEDPFASPSNEENEPWRIY